MRYVLTRLVLVVPTLLLLSAVTFFLGFLTPSDPVIVKLGQHADPAAAARLRHEYGLDRPPLEQFGHFLWGAVRGDFGISYYDDSPVSRTLGERVPTTLALGLVATCFAVAVGVPLGVLAAIRRDSWIDRTTMGLSLVGLSVPGFVIGPLLIWLFASLLGWLPVARWGQPVDFVLPAITLASRPTALIARIMRTSMLEVVAQDYVRTALAKGLTRGRVLFLHAFKNAIIPTLTVVGTAAGGRILRGGDHLRRAGDRLPLHRSHPAAGLPHDPGDDAAAGRGVRHDQPGGRRAVRGAGSAHPGTGSVRREACRGRLG